MTDVWLPDATILINPLGQKIRNVLWIEDLRKLPLLMGPIRYRIDIKQKCMCGHWLQSTRMWLTFLLSISSWNSFLLEETRYFPTLVGGHGGYVIWLKCPNYFWPGLSERVIRGIFWRRRDASDRDKGYLHGILKLDFRLITHSFFSGN